MLETIQCKFKSLLKDRLDSLTDMVFYHTLDQNDHLIEEYKDVCFRDISVWAIPENVKKIVVIHPLSRIPYHPEFIPQWIKEINNLGFPCNFVIKNNDAHFSVELKHIEYKNHLIYTLQLIRVLFETGLCYVPELYFDLIEKDSNIDRFIALQIAHKNLELLRPYVCSNANHAITSLYNGAGNITKAQFLERLSKTIGIYSDGRTAYTFLWRL